MTYNKKILKTLKGFTNLSIDERTEFIKYLNEFQRASYFERQEKSNTIEKRLNVGPTGNDHCPCCGKS